MKPSLKENYKPKIKNINIINFDEELKRLVSKEIENNKGKVSLYLSSEMAKEIEQFDNMSKHVRDMMEKYKYIFDGVPDNAFTSVSEMYRFIVIFDKVNKTKKLFEIPEIPKTISDSISKIENELELLKFSSFLDNKQIKLLKLEIMEDYYSNYIKKHKYVSKNKLPKDFMYDVLGKKFTSGKVPSTDYINFYYELKKIFVRMIQKSVRDNVLEKYSCVAYQVKS